MVLPTIPLPARLAARYRGLMPMTTDELRELIDSIGWTQGDLARYSDRDLARTHKQARGKEPIDEPLAAWLRAVAALLTNPPPKARRIRDTDAGNQVRAAR